MEKENLKVIVFQAENVFVASCLDMDLVIERKTQNEALDDITRLIQINIFGAQRKRMSLERAFSKAPEEYFIKYNQGIPLDYAPNLSLRVSDIANIEYRINS